MRMRVLSKGTGATSPRMDGRIGGLDVEQDQDSGVESSWKFARCRDRWMFKPRAEMRVQSSSR